MNKKKYIILFILLLTFTGCFNDEVKENINEEVQEVIEEYEYHEELNIDNLEIKKVISTSKNYAVVEDKEKDVYIINSDNKYVGIIDNSNDHSIYQINDNGYVYQNINGEERIYDKTGKMIITSSSDEKYYYGISNDNLLIRKVKNSNNSLKEEYRYEVVDTNKKVIINDLKKELGLKEKGSITVIYLGGNIYVINSKEKEFLYNIKLNKYSEVDNLDYVDCSKIIKEVDNLDKCYQLINDNMIRINNNKTLILKDLSIISLSKYDVVIDENYYYKESDSTIRKYDDKIVKEIIDYKINDSIIINDKYYFATDKGLILLDKNFNETGTPVILGSSIKKLTEYGIIVNKNSSKRESLIYDYDLKTFKDLDNLYLYEPQDFIAKSFIDGVTKDTLPYNIKVKKEINIGK